MCFFWNVSSEMAELVGDVTHQRTYAAALELAVRNLIGLQYTRRTVPRSLAQSKLVGAFRVRAGDGRIRIDTTQHAMDAYRKIPEVFAKNERAAWAPLAGEGVAVGVPGGVCAGSHAC